jgi:uncharacterized membrane protein
MRSLFFSAGKKVFRYTIAIVLIICGIIMTPLPIPFGLISIATGALLLAHESEWVKERIRRMRMRYPRLSRQMEWLEDCRFRFIADIIILTKPESSGEQAPSNR